MLAPASLQIYHTDISVASLFAPNYPQENE